MTVGDLRKQLLSYPQNLQVVQAVDPEGNGFWDSVATAVVYIASCEDFMTEFEHDEEPDHECCVCQKVVCIWPA